MKRSVLLGIFFFIVALNSMHGQTYYRLYAAGGGEGEGFVNTKTFLDFWGINFLASSHTCGWINSNGHWLALDPSRTDRSKAVLVELNEEINKIPRLAFATDGSMGARNFELHKLGYNSILNASFGLGFDDIPTIFCNLNTPFRIGGLGGVGLWADNGVLRETEPMLKIDKDGVIANHNVKVYSNGVGVLIGDADNGSSAWIGSMNKGQGLYLGAAYSSQFYIDEHENVFIGLNKAGAAAVNQTLKDKFNLFVTKGVLSENLAIAPQNSWSDFVFNEDYNLREIREVEDFISVNKHLPDVPSAKQVQEEGYSQHDMNKVLLQKIEELTLYTIQQQKEIKALKDELDRMKDM